MPEAAFRPAIVKGDRFAGRGDGPRRYGAVSAGRRLRTDLARGPSRRAEALGLEALLLFASSLAVWWLSARFVNAAWSWIALVQFLWLCVLCYRIEPQGMALFLPVAITRASVVVALIAIEHGARLPELGLAGTPGSHAASYVAICAVLFASYLAAFRLLPKLVRRQAPNVLSAIFDRHAVAVSAGVVALGAGATLWLLVIGGARGYPLLAGVDRFVFRRLFADPLTVNILNFKSILAGGLGLVSFCLPVSVWWKRAAMMTCLVFIASNFLFGDKFFAILMTISCFLAPYLFRNHRVVSRKIGTVIAVAAIAMTPIMGVTWFIYSDGGRMSAQATSQRLGERFAAQGELWYVQNRIGAPLVRWDAPFVRRNVEAMAIKNVDVFALRNGLGPAYFMNRYSPDHLRAAQGRHAGAVTYTMALEPLLLVQFGWIGMVCGLAFTALLFALASLYVAYAIERRLIVSMMFGSYIMVLLRSFSTQGTPWVIASVFTLKWLSVVLAIELALRLVEASQGGVPSAGQRRTAGGRAGLPSRSRARLSR